MVYSDFFQDPEDVGKQGKEKSVRFELMESDNEGEEEADDKKADDDEDNDGVEGYVFKIISLVCVL